MSPHFQYKINADVTFEQVYALYESVEWKLYTDSPVDLMPMLQSSWVYITAWNNEELIGLVRSVSDGCTIAYIQDILVKPSYQRQGIGTELMKLMAHELDGIRQQVLTTDETPATVSFYQSLGWQPMDQYGCISFMKLKISEEDNDE